MDIANLVSKRWVRFVEGKPYEKRIASAYPKQSSSRQNEWSMKLYFYRGKSKLNHAK
jgi:hypothetical protein